MDQTKSQATVGRSHGAVVALLSVHDLGVSNTGGAFRAPFLPYLGTRGKLRYLSVATTSPEWNLHAQFGKNLVNTLAPVSG